MAELAVQAGMPSVEPTALRRCNEAWQRPHAGLPLTVVVPFLNYDVCPLAQRLLELAARAPVPVPIVFVDDGSSDPSFGHALWELLGAAAQPCQLATLQRNVGRARVRNYLCGLAGTPYLLYLDADMWPDHDDFLARYLGWLEGGSVDVIYGGRSADKVVLEGPEFELHRSMTVQREALSAAVRSSAPAYHFYSCNFVVRRDLLQAFPLDERFTGWGWEDCEWASRVAERHVIRHEDNAASHLGLLTATQILKKYDESTGNFRLILERRPEIVKPTALYRVARAIGRFGLSQSVGRWARRLATATWLPVALRMRGLMLYKAALYAPVVCHRAD